MAGSVFTSSFHVYFRGSKLCIWINFTWEFNFAHIRHPEISENSQQI